ncbi:hypothetical protein B0H13DRAFT_410396 [Mycena leptocephala]|nr:hypothetical protein B0H13DRAFT_410396 [Mycena leptocephala]
MLPSQLFSTVDTWQMFISFTRPKCFPHAVMAPAKAGTEPNPATEFVSQRFFRGGPLVSVPSDNVPLSPSSLAMGRTTIYSRHAAIALDNLTTWWSPPPHKPYRDMFAFPFPCSLQRSADVPCPRQSAVRAGIVWLWQRAYAADTCYPPYIIRNVFLPVITLLRFAYDINSSLPRLSHPYPLPLWMSIYLKYISFTFFLRRFHSDLSCESKLAPFQCLRIFLAPSLPKSLT